MSEVLPMQIRGRGTAFATGIGNWAVNVLFSQVKHTVLYLLLLSSILEFFLSSSVLTDICTTDRA